MATDEHRRAPANDFNVLPEDVPHRSPQLEVTVATHQIAAGEDHHIDVLLSDGGSDVKGCTLHWTPTGAKPPLAQCRCEAT